MHRLNECRRLFGFFIGLYRERCYDSDENGNAEGNGDETGNGGEYGLDLG